MPKNVIVVGMARSGTSLTASIFARKGYFVAEDPGEQLQAADRNNPGGFWELEDLKEANAGLFAAVGFPHHNTWTSGEIQAQQAEAIGKLEHLDEHKGMVEYYEGKQPWLWKDPRFCYTLGYWWPLMNPETTGVLLVTRNPSEIRRSLLRANWGDAPSGDKTAYLKRIEDHIDFVRRTIKVLDIPHVEIDYGDYSDKSQETAEKLGRFFGIELSPDDLGYESKYNTSAPRGYVAFMVERIARILPPGLRRFLKKALPASVIRALIPNRTNG
jgi:hypothetical protein